MRYDKQIKLFKSVKTPNGMGGYTKENVLVATIDGYVTPTKIETTFTNGMLITINTMKVFTKEKIPDNANFEFSEIDFIEYENVVYNVLNFANFGKVKLWEVEVVPNGER